MPSGRLVWLEISAQAEPTLAPAAQAHLPQWQAAGWQLQGQAVPGPAFWQTTEIEDAPALLAATLAALSNDKPVSHAVDAATAAVIPT